MSKGKNRPKYVAKPVVNKSVAAVDGEPRKLTKQEKRNLKKQERRVAEAGQCVRPVSHQDPNSGGEHVSVYKRVPVYPTSFPLPSSASAGFIEPHNKIYKKVLDACYQGFAVQNENSFPAHFHEKFQTALKGLEETGHYQFDMTQPAGLRTKVARTFVTRCVVGEPGMTYKYLGLRMFGFPWVKGATGSNEHTIAIGKLNDELIKRSNDLNKQSGKEEFGSSNFNLTLINRCYPEGEEVTLKNEPMFEKDKMTVSWHADSCLDHFSTIAVYHCNESSAPRGGLAKPWRAALRVQLNAEGPQQGKPVPDVEVDCPAVAVPLPDKCCYYLLDDFNHHHQHSVLAGGSHRFASTHRVSRREGHTYQYLHQRIQAALHEKTSADVKTIRKLFMTALEIEFEWLRQFYIQGKQHHDRHVWWHKPMEEFSQALVSIDQRLVKICKVLIDHADKVHTSTPASAKLSKDELKTQRMIESIEMGSLDEMILHVQERLDKRQGWELREQDPAIQSLDSSCKPLPVPIDDSVAAWSTIVATPQSSGSESAAVTASRQLLNRLQECKTRLNGNKKIF